MKKLVIFALLILIPLPIITAAGLPMGDMSNTMITTNPYMDDRTASGGDPDWWIGVSAQGSMVAETTTTKDSSAAACNVTSSSPNAYIDIYNDYTYLMDTGITYSLGFWVWVPSGSGTVEIVVQFLLYSSITDPYGSETKIDDNSAAPITPTPDTWYYVEHTESDTTEMYFRVCVQIFLATSGASVCVDDCYLNSEPFTEFPLTTTLILSSLGLVTVVFLRKRR